MLTIRLSRVGKRNAAVFHIVLAEKSKPVKGKFVELLGFYNPRTKEKSFKADRIKYWQSQGVGFSPTVHNLLIDAKIIEGEKVKAWRPKKKKGGEAPVEAKPATQATEEKKEDVSAEKEKTEEAAPVLEVKNEEAVKTEATEIPTKEAQEETGKGKETEAPKE